MTLDINKKEKSAAGASLYDRIAEPINFEQVSKLLEGFVFDQAVKAQRALLTNLKVRLKK